MYSAGTNPMILRYKAVANKGSRSSLQSLSDVGCIHARSTWLGQAKDHSQRRNFAVL